MSSMLRTRIDWEAEEDTQLAFERAAVEAAQGWIAALIDLDEALEREDKLKAQLAALIGLEPRQPVVELPLA